MKQVKPAQYTFDPLLESTETGGELEAIVDNRKTWEFQFGKLRAIDRLQGLWPGRVRVACDGDIFKDAVGDNERTVCWTQFVSLPRLVWLLSTTNPEKMASEFTRLGRMPNLWAGLKMNQEFLTDRLVAQLVGIGAPVSFLEIEVGDRPCVPLPLQGIKWVIAKPHVAGSECVDDLVQVRDQCKAAGVKFFFDGLGNILGDQVHREFPVSPVSWRLYRWYARESGKFCEILSKQIDSVGCWGLCSPLR